MLSPAQRMHVRNGAGSIDARQLCVLQVYFSTRIRVHQRKSTKPGHHITAHAGIPCAGTQAVNALLTAIHSAHAATLPSTAAALNLTPPSAAGSSPPPAPHKGPARATARRAAPHQLAAEGGPRRAAQRAAVRPRGTATPGLHTPAWWDGMAQRGATGGLNQGRCTHNNQGTCAIPPVTADHRLALKAVHKAARCPQNHAHVLIVTVRNSAAPRTCCSSLASAGSWRLRRSRVLTPLLTSSRTCGHHGTVIGQCHLRSVRMFVWSARHSDRRVRARQGGHEACAGVLSLPAVTWCSPWR